MNIPTLKLTIALMTLVLGFSSCASNAELEDRLERRNQNHSNLQERREMRLDARQERTDAWFDRVMH
ncbi:hypothetical protein FEM03_05030 [Phragmitibacter flavus]|uniref:Uncharacterized protein n=1 Tax=Phragmitibacter flavus TaxID=2576071 RepID=A0A5R8KII0_9BACT|nr:hypothetical protein [Phragmitibacter flavus]TLD72092.1 hypothetical protein FEM03_05030 [Phragmitibacter flavus]